MKKKLIIIGTSQIIEAHIKSLSKFFKVVSIFTTNKHSKSIFKIAKKYNISNVFFDLNECIELNKDQDCHYLVAPRIKDTTKISLKILSNTKSKILVEKPISNNLNDLKKLSYYNKRIFVGYNRLFYNNVNYIKKDLKSNKSKIFCFCSIPEKNLNDIVNNSCHVISILFFLFGDMKIVIKKKDKNFVSCYLKSNISDIFIKIYFNASENFKIEINSNTKFYKFNSVEYLEIYDGIRELKSKNIKSFLPKKILVIDENKNNTFKPGFYNQAKRFSMFVKNNRFDFVNTLDFSRKVLKICKSLSE